MVRRVGGARDPFGPVADFGGRRRGSPAIASSASAPDPLAGLAADDVAEGFLVAVGAPVRVEAAFGLRLLLRPPLAVAPPGPGRVRLADPAGAVDRQRRGRRSRSCRAASSPSTKQIATSRRSPPRMIRLPTIASPSRRRSRTGWRRAGSGRSARRRSRWRRSSCAPARPSRRLRGRPRARTRRSSGRRRRRRRRRRSRSRAAAEGGKPSVPAAIIVMIPKTRWWTWRPLSLSTLPGHQRTSGAHQPRAHADEGEGADEADQHQEGALAFVGDQVVVEVEDEAASGSAASCRLRRRHPFRSALSRGPRRRWRTGRGSAARTRSRRPAR